jgi:hypothetical protein
VRFILTAVVVRPDGYVLLQDSEVILRLNQILAARDPRRFKGRPSINPDAVWRDVEAANRWLADRLTELDIPFRVPTVACSCLLLPSRSGAQEIDGSENPFEDAPLDA